MWGNEHARERLRELAVDEDKKIARIAARALYGGPQKSKRRTSPLTRARLQRIRGDAQPSPLLYRSVVAAIRGLPEIRAYEETDMTHSIARMCADYSTTRRKLVSGRDRLMRREKGIYSFEPLGEAVWRVEKFIQAGYLDLERY